jgi:ATP-dependent helicase/nuclease subunit B
MTLPSEKLILTYHDTNASGGTCALSLAVRRVAELLPHLAVKDLVEYGSESIEERLMTPALAFEALPSLMGTPYYAALVDVLSRDERYAPFLKRSEMPIDNADSSISQEVASSVFGKHISLTQTKIDKYVSCQFSYYCDFVLKLMECSKANFQSSNSGTFIHRILEVFMAAVTDENGLRRDVEFEEIRRMVVEETERYIAELCEGRKKLPKRLTHLFTRLSRLAVTIAMDLYAEFSQSAFVPRLFEAKIGNDSKYGISSPTVKLADGSTVSIYGTIDRVDVYKSGDIVYVKVVDYKTGKKQFSLKDIEKV